MKQSRFMSLLETSISTATGFAISLIAQMVFLPLIFGISVHIADNIAFALIMTVISLARGFILRRVFEAFHIRVPLSPALIAIAEERRRQIEKEGWTPAHDAAHAPGVLAQAGACYAMMPRFRRTGHHALNPTMPGLWPWESGWLKPHGDWRDCVRGAALIVAEMDRADYVRKHQ
jgi:hypothetical protein